MRALSIFEETMQTQNILNATRCLDGKDRARPDTGDC